MSGHPDIFESPALPLLLELESSGFTFKVEGDRLLVRPLERLTPEQRELLRRERAAAILLLRVFDDGVQDRRAAFVAQLTATPPPAIPAFLFKPDVPYLPGVCFSCGEPNQREGRAGGPVYGRCVRCSLAWRLAAGIPIPAPQAIAHDEAKRIA